jgi:hypothetical protein
MAERRSLVAVGRAHEGGRRFDYFVLSVVIALCAYLGQTIKPEKLGSSPYTIEALSVVILVASAFCGFRRLQKKIRLDELNHVLLDAYEKKGAIVSHEKNKPGQPFTNAGTGDVYLPADLQAKKNDLEKELSKFHDEADIIHKKAELYGTWRNGLLGVGFGGLFLAKLLAPYFC